MRSNYVRRNINLHAGAAGNPAEIQQLQLDLRQLGYLAAGIDGTFGTGTGRAVKGLQYDLLHNHGQGHDGEAPVSMVDYNRNRVTLVTGRVDYGFAQCVQEMLADANFPKVPHSANPTSDNATAVRTVSAMSQCPVPVPFLLAILGQESGLCHYQVSDGYVTVGLDTGAAEKHIITSRGYGVGQYTLFHHPPTPQEMDAFVTDVAGNVQKAARELRDKFDHFVLGGSTGTTADDRKAECGEAGLRVCKYATSDPNHMRGCKQCALNAGSADIECGSTKWFPGSAHVYEPGNYQKRRAYADVPVRKNFGCDWPYAVRRYNGAGQDSYHYQAQVLLRVKKG